MITDWLVIVENNFLTLLQTSTDTRINEKWVVNDDRLRDIVKKFPTDTKFLNFNDTYSTNKMDNALYQQSFLQVVTETVFYYPVTFFSEKTSKPILNKRPFVIVGPVGSLASLRSLGFKTFSDYWNEEYDTIEDPSKRLIAIVDIIEWVCNQPIEDIRSLCKDMESVLNYNFNYYTSKFKHNELQKFELACINNLKPRYDPN